MTYGDILTTQWSPPGQEEPPEMYEMAVEKKWKTYTFRTSHVFYFLFIIIIIKCVFFLKHLAQVIGLFITYIYIYMNVYVYQ